MFKQIISAKKFWKSVIIMSVAFIFLFNLVRIAIEFGFSFSDFWAAHSEPQMLPYFVVFNLFSGFVYGFGVVYYRYWKAMRERRNQ